ncbi:MAG TPA: ABC transporter permease [Alphaproteobacteria bacterium]|jgi:phospholipid/cholesterol/gamma-HCH transport system permease protein|nr:ABC transporter permease [Alphaproteobacteria bacterium]
MIDFLSLIGERVLGLFSIAGRLSLFAAQALSHCFRPPIYFRNVIRQFMTIGYNSLPVVGLTAFFTGAVLALQASIGFSKLTAPTAIPMLVVVSVTRELGPVLASLMVAGRAGAAIAAELGTMRVTEQIDALETLATNPIKYLIVPRVLAGVLMMPLLVLIADVIGVMGGFIVSSAILEMNEAAYIKTTMANLTTFDVVSGLIKAAVFGLIIAILGCFNGYNSRGGAQGVGAATTNAVVYASVLILFFDYFLTELFLTR